MQQTLFSVGTVLSHSARAAGALAVGPSHEATSPLFAGSDSRVVLYSMFLNSPGSGARHVPGMLRRLLRRPPDKAFRLIFIASLFDAEIFSAAFRRTFRFSPCLRWARQCRPMQRR